MSDSFIGMITFLIIITIMGFPVGLALFSSAILYFIIQGQDPTFAAEIILHGLYANFVLLAIPLFIFSANIMNNGSITDRLLAFCLALVGHRRAGSLK